LAANFGRIGPNAPLTGAIRKVVAQVFQPAGRGTFQSRVPVFGIGDLSRLCRVRPAQLCFLEVIHSFVHRHNFRIKLSYNRLPLIIGIFMASIRQR